MRLVLGVLLALIAGCASTQVTEVHDAADVTPRPRPARIVVHDFAVDRGEVRLDSAILARAARRRRPPTRAELNHGHEVAAALTRALVREIQALGMPAEPAADGRPAGADALEIEGQFVTIDEGGERTVVGLGAGAGAVHTRVEVHRVLGDGRREVLQEAAVVAADGAVPTARAIARVLGALFVRHGWIGTYRAAEP